MIKLSALDESVQEVLEQELEDHEPKLIQTIKAALLDRLQQDFEVVDDDDVGDDDEEESKED